MTIAVAAKYPWGVLKQLLSSSVQIPEAIVLASDSRYSRQIASGYVPMLDSGTKIFQLGNDVAGVYAGVSRIGEICFDELRFRLSQQRNPTSASSRKIAQETLSRAYGHEVAVMHLDPDKSPLYILIGACSRQGQAELYRFSYNEDFTPVWVDGLDVLGWRQTADRFIDLISGELQRNVESELSLRSKHPQIPIAQWVPMPIKDAHAAMLTAAVLSSIVEEGSDVTIGGQIQLAIVAMNGISYPNVSFSTKPFTPHPEWTKVTADASKLITVTGISGTIGVYHSDV